MNKSIEGISQFIQSGIPEIPPEYPFNPPEPMNSPTVSMPMVYVDSTEKAEYRVFARETVEPKQLEAELNALGEKGWWLAAVVNREKETFFVLSRRKV